MKQRSRNERVFPAVRILAENPDNLPRLERLAQILRLDERRFLGLERPPYRTHLSKVLRDCLLEGGVLLAGHQEREILFCLAMRPLETTNKKKSAHLPRSFEVVAFGHNWGAIRGMGIQLREEEVIGESLALLQERLAALSHFQLGNGQGEPSVSPKVYFIQQEFHEELSTVQKSRELLEKLSTQFTGNRGPENQIPNPITEQHIVLGAKEAPRVPLQR